MTTNYETKRFIFDPNRIILSMLNKVLKFVKIMDLVLSNLVRFCSLQLLRFFLIKDLRLTTWRDDDKIYGRERT